jgi:FtsP/CotA-like multicopper oxidase with cupredoxin domain
MHVLTVGCELRSYYSTAEYAILWYMIYPNESQVTVHYSSYSHWTCTVCGSLTTWWWHPHCNLSMCVGGRT